MQPWKLVPLRICHRRKAAEFTSTGIPGGPGVGRRGQSWAEAGSDHAWHSPLRSAGHLHRVPSALSLCPSVSATLGQGPLPPWRVQTPFPEEKENLRPI